MLSMGGSTDGWIQSMCEYAHIQMGRWEFLKTDECADTRMCGWKGLIISGKAGQSFAHLYICIFAYFLAIFAYIYNTP
jgi:hypothetical protein